MPAQPTPATDHQNPPFGVTAITDLLTQGIPLEDVQHLAGHAEPRSTGFSDRGQKIMKRNSVERISTSDVWELIRPTETKTASRGA